MANRIPRVPVREQDPQVRARNFEEVCHGYNKEEALLEATRCLHCKNPPALSGSISLSSWLSLWREISMARQR